MTLPTMYKQVDVANRRLDVVRLRAAGKDWRQVAAIIEEKYGVARLPSTWDRRFARRDFQNELKRLREEMHEPLSEIRDMENMRLDQMLESIWDKATGKGDTPWAVQRDAIDRVLQIMKRRAGLLGLDALEDPKADKTRSIELRVVNEAPKPDHVGNGVKKLEEDESSASESSASESFGSESSGSEGEDEDAS